MARKERYFKTNKNQMFVVRTPKQLARALRLKWKEY